MYQLNKLVTEPSDHIASALGYETHNPTTGMKGGHGGLLDRDRDIYREKLKI